MLRCYCSYGFCVLFCDDIVQCVLNCFCCCKFVDHVYSLSVSDAPITDSHAALQPFCQLLEVILRKGLNRKPSSNVCRLNRNCNSTAVEYLSLIHISEPTRPY